MPFADTTKRPPQSHVAESDAILKPLGYGQDKTISASSALPTIPSGSKFAWIQAVTQNIRWTDDASTPTASLGMQLEAGKDMWYTGDLTALLFIEEAATAELNVSYYGYA